MSHHSRYSARAAVLPSQPSDLFFGGVGSLADSLDKTILLVLRDGKLLLGTLSSYDQYGSLLLQDTRERVCAGGFFADAPVGLLLIRGENIALIGSVVSVVG
jgi:U6 snRNA-associated Sm-like protein LSm1